VARLTTSGETFLMTAMLCHLLPPSPTQHQYGVHTMAVRYAANLAMFSYIMQWFLKHGDQLKLKCARCSKKYCSPFYIKVLFIMDLWLVLGSFT